MSEAGLSARSVVASTLLGTVPPRLPGRLLVAFAQEFGIRPGTTRTALSRMVDRGELAHLDGGAYALTGDLLERHHRQEAGLHASTLEWDGMWEMVVVLPGARSSSDRSALRRACAHLGLWERREGVWLRPANLDPTRLPAAAAVVARQAEWWRAHPAGDARELLLQVYDHAGWAERARALIASFDCEPRSLANGFVVAADALRHLVSDPLLPDDLAPADWPAAELRAAYAAYLSRYQAGLRDFFRAQLAPIG